MKLSTSFLTLTLACASVALPRCVLGVTISSEQASNAVLYAIASSGSGNTIPKTSVSHVEPFKYGPATVGYVVSLIPSGFLLVRADDDLPPWKIQSTSGNFMNLPPSFVSILKLELAEELAALNRLHQANVQITSEFHKQWQSFWQTAGPSKFSLPPAGPDQALLTTAWQQTPPYNDDLPAIAGMPQDAGGHAYVGCGGCALAQILRYSTRPTAVLRDHQDTAPWSGAPLFISQYPMTPYNWNLMPNDFINGGTAAQRAEVARLNYHVAIAIDTLFMPGMSGNDPSRIPGALRSIFGYSCGDVERRDAFTASAWYDKIATDIDAYRPVFYSLHAADGKSDGHAAVCDGYRGGNQIHLNLGFGAAASTWYNLDVIAYPPPPNTIHSWSFHAAVFNIMPPDPSISSITPVAPTASPNAQQVTISGLNFDVSGSPSSSTLVFYDPANNAHPISPSSSTATTLQCSIPLSVAGQWRVIVVNGNQESESYSFAVTTTSSAVLTGLSINGPASVDENTSAQFSATAYFGNGTSQVVTPSCDWRQNSAVASISNSGLLTANSVNANVVVTVTAVYNSAGINKTTSAQITVLNKDGSTPTHPVQLVRNSDFSANAQNWTLTGNFQADARFSNAHSLPGYAYLANADGSAGSGLSGWLISDSFTVPSDARSVSLSYWYKITSSQSTAMDYVHCQLYASSPQQVYYGINDIWNTSASSAYQQYTTDISYVIGKTISVQFTGYVASASSPTTFRLDDITVSATVPDAPTPVSLLISGPSSVPEGQQAQYYATVVYSDGSTRNVGADQWGNNSPSIVSQNANGLLTAGQVSMDTAVSLWASATVNGTALNAFKDIVIVDETVVPKSVALAGPTTLYSGLSGRIACTVTFSDGTSGLATPQWSVDSSLATISSDGLLTASVVQTSGSVVVTARYSTNGVACTNSIQVGILAVPNVPLPTSLVINGPTNVVPGALVNYTATVHFDDNSSRLVNPTWSVDCTNATVTYFGNLDVGQLSPGSSVRLSATYSSGEAAITGYLQVLVAPPPSIRVRLDGASMILTWTTNVGPWVLESSCTLHPAGWTNVNLVPGIVGSYYALTNQVTDPVRFYRLRQP